MNQILFRNRWGIGELWYHLDGKSNVEALLDGAGDGLEKIKYDAFGRPTVIGFWDHNVRPASAYQNRFMFQGREYLNELGIYDYRHRYYQPDLGRFLQTDPMGLQTEGAKLTPEQKALYGAGAPEAFGSSEMNLFRYCGDDPVDRIDPLGLDATRGDWADRQADFFGYTSFGEYAHDAGQVFIGEGKGALNVLSLGLYSPSYANTNQSYGGVVGQALTVVVVAVVTRGEAKAPEVPSGSSSVAGNYRPQGRLPADEHGAMVPSSENAHTQIGTGRGGNYTAAREWAANGKPVRDIHFTDHESPEVSGHTNPHQHEWIPNETGGTPTRGQANPYRW
jgi:RHS repeat-associated protein